MAGADCFFALDVGVLYVCVCVKDKKVGGSGSSV